MKTCVSRKKKEKRLSNCNNRNNLSKTRLLKGEQKISKENEKNLATEKISDIAPENPLKEQPSKEEGKNSDSIERVRKIFREIQLTKL